MKLVVLFAADGLCVNKQREFSLRSTPSDLVDWLQEGGFVVGAFVDGELYGVAPDGVVVRFRSGHEGEVALACSGTSDCCLGSSCAPRTSTTLKAPRLSDLRPDALPTRADSRE